jgi:serine/threonine protein kinase
MTRICSVCGKMNPDSAGNCDVCGTRLDAAEAVSAGYAGGSAVQTVGAGGTDAYAGQPDSVAPGQPMSGPICPKCRRGNRSHSAFCAYCGYVLKPANGQGQQAGSNGLQAQAYAAQVITSAPATAHILPGDVSGNIPPGVLLKRRYRILRKIAQGGMGAVYESQDVTENDGRRWAVKEMSPAALPANERTQAIADFQREARILHGLKHPNLPQVNETFEEMGRHFLVMEFIAGRTLLNVVDTTPGFLPEQIVMVWARQLFEVLHYLHAQNPPIIYRDIKPANVMQVEGRELIKLIDFGIARFHRPGKGQDTEAFGTAGYAPPEQYGKGQTDQRSDIYALGATLHHLVTKQDPSLNPFNWVPARRINAGVSPALENALMVATSLDPARRYRHIEEFAQALGIYLPGGLPHARPLMVGMSTPRPYVVSAPPPIIATEPAAQAKPATSTAGQKPRAGSTPKKKTASSTATAPPKSQPRLAPAPVPIVASTATAGTAIQSAEIMVPTYTGVVNESQVGARPAALPVDKHRESSKLVVPEQVVDLGEARWNNRVSKKVTITSVGGAMRGQVIAAQPWIACNPQHFQGNAVTLDVRVKRRQLKFGRVELQVPNLFAIIWARSRKVLPFIMVWFWLIVLVTSSLGRTLLTVAAAVVGGLLVLEGLMWLWAQHVRLLVPTEKVNTGRLMLKSTDGDSSIEVRVLARPSWAQRAAGWSIALLLFVIEITLVTWIALSLVGARLPFSE